MSAFDESDGSGKTSTRRKLAGSVQIGETDKKLWKGVRIPLIRRSKNGKHLACVESCHLRDILDALGCNYKRTFKFEDGILYDVDSSQEVELTWDLLSDLVTVQSEHDILMNYENAPAIVLFVCFWEEVFLKFWHGNDGSPGPPLFNSYPKPWPEAQFDPACFSININDSWTHNYKLTTDRHKNKISLLRLDPDMRQQLDKLAERNRSTFTEEARIAIRKHLENNRLWPLLEDTRGNQAMVTGDESKERNDG